MGNPLQKKLIRELHGTRRSLREVCEDLGLDYQDVAETEDIGVAQCSHCNIWQTRLIPDLDGSPICRFCVDLIGM